MGIVHLLQEQNFTMPGSGLEDKLKDTGLSDTQRAIFKAYKHDRRNRNVLYQIRGLSHTNLRHGFIRRSFYDEGLGWRLS